MTKHAPSKFSVSGAMAVGLALVLSLSCLGTPVEAFTKQTGDRGEMLVGELTQKDLYKECPLFKENADQYVPDKNVVAKIKRIKEPMSIIMFLGTWCGDSQRESPKLLKILEAAKNSKISITMYGVDAAKDDGGGLTKKYDIQRVPTIIFLKGGKELGRIIEYPKDTMEEDFLAITGVK
ncbi:MAG: thioredoxin family protein [Syntrophobacteraceae bacterium]